MLKEEDVPPPPPPPFYILIRLSHPGKGKKKKNSCRSPIIRLFLSFAFRTTSTTTTTTTCSYAYEKMNKIEKSRKKRGKETDGRSDGQTEFVTDVCVSSSSFTQYSLHKPR